MLDARPVNSVIETRAVVFNVTLLTGLARLLAETWAGRFSMRRPGSMTRLALNIFQLRRVYLADKTAGLIESYRMANKTFRIEGLVYLGQGFICMAVSRLLPGFMFTGVTGHAGAVRGVNFSLLLFSLSRQRGHEQLFDLFIIL